MFFSETPDLSKNTDGEGGRGTEVGEVRGADGAAITRSKLSD